MVSQRTVQLDLIQQIMLYLRNLLQHFAIYLRFDFLKARSYFLFFFPIYSLLNPSSIISSVLLVFSRYLSIFLPLALHNPRFSSSLFLLFFFSFSLLLFTYGHSDRIRIIDHFRAIVASACARIFSTSRNVIE